MKRHHLQIFLLSLQQMQLKYRCFLILPPHLSGSVGKEICLIFILMLS